MILQTRLNATLTPVATRYYTPLRKMARLDGLAAERQSLAVATSCCGHTRSVLDELVARRADYVGFVRSRVRDDSLAEDIVQAALLKASERLEQLRAGESASAWFYRMLRNAVVDQRRREASARRGAERLAFGESGTVAAIERAPRPCRCVGKLMEGLKPEYAEALQRVEVDELSVKDFAREQATSANNAGVRLFRARAALKREVVATCGSCCADGGCFDCTCPDVSSPRP